MAGRPGRARRILRAFAKAIGALAALILAALAVLLHDLDGRVRAALDVHARVDHLDLARIATDRVKELRGRVSGRVDLRGEGLGAADLLRSLRGTIRIAARDVHGRAAIAPKVTLVNPALARVAEMARRQPGEARPIDLREATAAFDVAGGKLTTTDPILLRADGLEARLRGTIGFDRALGLDGQIDIAPSVIAEASRRMLIPVRPIPLRLRLTGVVGDVKLELLELGESALALRGAVRNALEQ